MAFDLTTEPVPTPLLRRKKAKRSAVHTLALVLVWLTVAASAFVFVEPAPVDYLTIGLFVVLPVIGLAEYPPALIAGFSLWLVTAAFGFLSATRALDTAEAVKHATISLYLYGACFIFALFVAKRPGLHTRLILNAQLFAAVIAAAFGIAGFLDLFPGAYDLFTRYDRAAGPFKDPNVYGPFLVTGLVTALHLWLTRPLSRGFGSLALMAFLTVGILFSFSRGAWAAAATALGVYGYLYMLTAKHNSQRLKLAALVVLGSAVLGLVLAVAMQSDAAANLLEQRAALTQSYDEGPEGRFGGQEKAFALILDNPFGIGAHQFSPYFHHEEPHNVYLSMTLNNGWMGGLLYLLIAAATLALGFRHALKNTKTRGLFLIVYAALVANILEGVLIDSDHWRHFYLLMGLVWGLIAGDRREIRSARIVADRRPFLKQGLVLIPPSRRQCRIVGKVLPRIPANRSLRLVVPQRPEPERRPPRILGDTR